MEILAAIILAAVVAFLFLGLFLMRTQPATDGREEEFAPGTGERSELARLVWAAHVSVQDHDETVLMGTPDQVAHSLMNVIYTSNNLENYLRQQKEKSHDKSE